MRRSVAAQEWPYFVTYSHALEEPGNLEVEFRGVQASPKYGNSFSSATIEFEYGATAWWTTEFYLSGQHTSNDSTVFTGYRWENRFRPLLREHFINPVLYVEYENLNKADRSLLEVVGHDSISDLRLPNAEGRSVTERELELKLILSSNVRGWNISENFISAKNLVEPEPLGIRLCLRGKPSADAWPQARKDCVFCRENFSAGAEIYGGLGDLDSFGLPSDLALRRSHGGLQYSARTHCQLFPGFRIERKQRRRALPLQGVLRIPADIQPLSPEGEMSRSPCCRRA